MTGPEARVFGVPPGADFPRHLVEGLLARLDGQPPEALARVEVFLNTRRMQRRVREILGACGARLLPRLRLVTDLALESLPGVPPPVPPLRRRLELMQLVARLIEVDPGLAPPTAAFDLADSLAALLEEMQGEGVTPAALAGLDMAEHAQHWQRSQRFLDLIAPFFRVGRGDAPVDAPVDAPIDAPIDSAARAWLAVSALEERWAQAPPPHPVIVAGSTGSRGTTARLMRAVARLPAGALVLPGFDFDMPDEAWDALPDALSAEDHPQYRFRALFESLGVTPAGVRPWAGAAPPCLARNRLISLAMRPAPVTDRWMSEGAMLEDLAAACARLVLIEAPSPRAEALAIALRLRRAAEEGVVAALITPDRQLTRQVAAALDRWRIRPDDSAGRPLAQSAPGRLLRHVAALRSGRATIAALVTLLKHPLTHSGADRGEHLRHSRDLELHLRRHGPAFPDGAALRGWAVASAAGWADWLAGLLQALPATGARPLAEHVADHLALTQALAGGPAGGSGGLWEAAAGDAARATMADLEREASYGGRLTAAEYAALVEALLSRREVREPVQPHPLIRIWGTLEARVQGADLVIAAGLNEGVWPELPAPDPWLNRRMRRDAGLLLPERQIGLAAHDFQQAACATEVVLSRACRDAEAETVPSRWLNRLTNLLSGLEAQGGAVALAEMRARGAVLLAEARRLDAEVAPVPSAPRPAPRPPRAARPRQLSVTRIETLIRDPFAIYAREVLRLRPLDPLHPLPDALLRGTVLHEVVERFVASREAGESRADALARLRALAGEVLERRVPWPAARRLWHARLDRVAGWFLDLEAARGGEPLGLEVPGRIELAALGFTLTAKADRIDRLPDGRLEILDYKTGRVPSPREQELFAKQLLLEAAIADRGGFAAIPRHPVAQVTYVGLGSRPRVQITPVGPDLLARTWEELGALIARYLSPEQGFTARRALHEERREGDYDHLARFGEWGLGDPPQPEDVGSGP